MAIGKRLDEDLIPRGLNPYCDLVLEDDRILVYSGDFTLRHNGETTTFKGNISYTFSCGIQLEFRGSCKIDASQFFGNDMSLQIITPNGQRGDGLLCSLTSSAEGVSCRGILYSLSAEPIECSRWHWSFLNMEKFIGDCILRISPKNRSVSRDRLSFKCQDGTMIILENLADNPSVFSQNRISHQCELIPANGKAISIDEAIKYIHAFSQFISFVVGRYHGPILIYGESTDCRRYMYHYSEHDKSKVGASSWRPFPEDKDIETLWPAFESIWNGKDKDKADILSTAIHWYMEANMNSGKMEGAYIMAITGIEMMWNVILPKRKENRRRSLLMLIKRLYEKNPQKENSNQNLQALIGKMKYSPSFDVSVLIKTRNYLVHYDGRNRKKYQRLSHEQKLDILEQALNVLALTILYWLGYEGHYADRTNENKWRGASTVKVPWANTQ